MRLILALDIGGTYTRAALYREGKDAPIRRARGSTRVEGKTVFEAILSIAREAIPPEARVDAAGVAAPGPLDAARGLILSAPNLPELDSFPLADALSRALGAPVFLGNDANIAALGEWRYGAARGHQDVLYLTLSTGIGGGVICGGRLLKGTQGIGGELGHVTVLPNGPLCSCGKRGHLEAIASGTAIARWVREQLAAGRESSLKGESAAITAEHVAIAARSGDALAQEAFARAGHYLGIAVGGFLNIFNPSILVFGGGVAKSRALFWESFQESLKESAFTPQYLESLEIADAALGEDAGLLGARTLVQLSDEDSTLSR